MILATLEVAAVAAAAVAAHLTLKEGPTVEAGVEVRLLAEAGAEGLLLL